MLRTPLSILTLISAGVTINPNLALLPGCRIAEGGTPQMPLSLLKRGARGLRQLVYLEVLVKLIGYLEPIGTSV